MPVVISRQALALHLLQACVVYINTLMNQQSFFAMVASTGAGMPMLTIKPTRDHADRILAFLITLASCVPCKAEPMNILASNGQKNVYMSLSVSQTTFWIGSAV